MSERESREMELRQLSDSKYRTDYRLSHLRDSAGWNNFLNDPDALLWNRVVDNRIILMILELIYYYKWIMWGGSIGIEGLTYDYLTPSGKIELVEINTLKVKDIGRIAKTLSNEKIGKYDKYGPQDKVVLDFLSATLTDNTTIFDYLPRDVRYAFDADEICSKCTKVMVTPSGSLDENYAELYIRFKIWGIKIYDENGKSVELDIICDDNLSNFCTEKQMDEFYNENWHHIKEKRENYPE